MARFEMWFHGFISGLFLMMSIASALNRSLAFCLGALFVSMLSAVITYRRS